MDRERLEVHLICFGFGPVATFFHSILLAPIEEKQAPDEGGRRIPLGILLIVSLFLGGLID
jgi:hypothetical protein